MRYACLTVTENPINLSSNRPSIKIHGDITALATIQNNFNLFICVSEWGEAAILRLE